MNNKNLELKKLNDVNKLNFKKIDLNFFKNI